MIKFLKGLLGGDILAGYWIYHYEKSPGSVLVIAFENSLTGDIRVKRKKFKSVLSAQVYMWNKYRVNEDSEFYGKNVTGGINKDSNQVFR